MGSHCSCLSMREAREFTTDGCNLLVPKLRNALCLKVGDTVLLPEFGGTKIELEDKEYTLLREAEIVAKLSKE